MAITDLTNTTWTINSSVTGLSANADFSVNFESGGSDYVSISYRLMYPSYMLGTNSNNVGQLLNGQTIHIIDGQDVTNSQLITWIGSNATQILPPDIIVSYDGDTIVSLNDSGTEILDTKGTFLTDNITIEYVKPSAPSPSLQSKTVSPSTSSQTVSPDSGYDGLSSVTVNAMPSGTAGTPTATKGTVSNNSVSVTPSVTNTTGYITGSTITGTAVTVSASELVSGTLSITSNANGINVANYASVDVNVSGGSDDELKNFIENYSTIQSFNNSSISKIGQYAFAYASALNTVSMPAVTYIYSYAFYSCRYLSSAVFPSAQQMFTNVFAYCSRMSLASFPNAIYVPDHAFYYCSSLQTIYFPKAAYIQSSAFYYCQKITEVDFPLCSKVSSGAFGYCASLTTASFSICSRIESAAFSRCYNLISLYLLYSSIASLPYSNAFSSTPIGGYSASAGQYGTIYVPSSLLSSYKTATNWTYFSSRMVGV